MNFYCWKWGGNLLSKVWSACKSIKIQGARIYVNKTCRTNIQLAFCIFFFMVTWASRFWRKYMLLILMILLIQSILFTLTYKQPINDSHPNWLSQSIQICVFNIRSVMNELSNFQSFVYSNPFEIYCIANWNMIIWFRIWWWDYSLQIQHLLQR